MIFFSLGPHLRHTEVPRLGVKSELQLLPSPQPQQHPIYLSHVCSLHHSAWQCRILNPLSKVRDCTCILMDTKIRFC